MKGENTKSMTDTNGSKCSPFDNQLVRLAASTMNKMKEQIT